MSRIGLLVIAILALVKTEGRAALLYSESWETTYINTQSSNGLYNPTGSPQYCVNPEPENNCSKQNGACAQPIGPVIPLSRIPDPTCKHALNLGGVADGFPQPVHGNKVFRGYSHKNDPAVKSHISRAELSSRPNHPMNATRTVRWWGYAFQVPDNHDAFSYASFDVAQWHTVSHTNGGPPLHMVLHGGLRDPWRKKIGFRIKQNYGATRAETKIVPDVNGRDVPASRIDGDGNKELFIVKDTQVGGNINDLGNWMYFVFKIVFDNRASGNRGEFRMWYASQEMIDSCQGTGMDCYMNVYNYGPGFRMGYADDNSNYFLLGGTLDTDNKDNDHYPLITYYDNFKVSDGARGSDALNFAEVDPALGSAGGGSGGDSGGGSGGDSGGDSGDGSGDASVGDGGTEPVLSQVAFEAEQGDMSGAMEQVQDSDASEGQYIRSTSNNQGELTLNVNTSEFGVYKIRGRVYAPDSQSDSFYYSINDQEEEIWDFRMTHNLWQEREVSKRGSGTYSDPEVPVYTFELPAGDHKIVFRGRDAGARLDYLVLEKIGGDSSLEAPRDFNVSK